MLRRVLLIILIGSTRALAADSSPGWSISERPDGSRLINGRWLRPAWTARWNELVELTLQDGQLLPNRAAVDGLRARLRGRQNALVRIEWSPDFWLISAGKNADGATI